LIKIALAGIGKIALDQHVPALAGSRDWDLSATVSRSGTVDGITSFTDFNEMLVQRPNIRTVSLCLPPLPRFSYAEAALLAGRHVMLEKPPGATLSEVHALTALAQDQRLTLFTSWHSREAKMVDAARAWLADKAVTRAHITWQEDVRHWHPGQDWVFEPGGMGVFDPGINALSIITKILPMEVHVQKAVLHVPQNRQTPIAAQLSFSHNVTAEFDWLKTGAQRWDIEVVTPDGCLRLTDGGDVMTVNGLEVAPSEAGITGEYPRLYARFAKLIDSGTSDVDLTPMTHVADAFTLGERQTTAPFEF
jgi:D-galactose 1-dehydrogenase